MIITLTGIPVKGGAHSQQISHCGSPLPHGLIPTSIWAGLYILQPLLWFTGKRPFTCVIHKLSEWDRDDTQVLELHRENWHSLNMFCILPVPDAASANLSCLLLWAKLLCSTTSNTEDSKHIEEDVQLRDQNLQSSELVLPQMC